MQSEVTTFTLYGVPFATNSTLNYAKQFLIGKYQSDLAPIKSLEPLKERCHGYLDSLGVKTAPN